MNIPTYISIGFVLSTLALFGFIIYCLNAYTPSLSKEDKTKTITVFSSVCLIWLFGLGVMVDKGFFDELSVLPPRFPLIILPPFIGIFLLSKNKVYREIIDNMPKQYLIGIQSFRIIIELLLFSLAFNSLLPERLSFKGSNYDIFPAILAILIAILVKKNLIKFRKIAILFNWIGMIILATVVIQAILSFPTPIQMYVEEPSMRIMTQMPIVWLPGFIVPMAFLFHIASLKQLKKK